jgi:hypothetical protein
MICDQRLLGFDGGAEVRIGSKTAPYLAAGEGGGTSVTGHQSGGSHSSPWCKNQDIRSTCEKADLRPLRVVRKSVQ